MFDISSVVQKVTETAALHHSPALAAKMPVAQGDAASDLHTTTVHDILPCSTLAQFYISAKEQ